MNKNIEKFNDDINHRMSAGQSIIDAIIDYCRENELEVESVKEVIKKLPKLKQQLRIAGEEQNLLIKKKRLPI